MKAAGNYIFIKPIETEITKAGLELQDDKGNKMQKGIVLSVGKNCPYDEIKEGVQILFNRTGLLDAFIGIDKILYIHYKYIYAVLER